MRERRLIRYIVMSYVTARENAARFRALTGITVEIFDSFLPYFADTHDEYFRWHTVDGRKRSGIRPHTIQRNSPLPGVAERLFFVLVVLKQNAIQELIAEMFGMTQTQCNQWFHCLYGILVKALEESGHMPASTNEGLQRMLEGMKADGQSPDLLHDGTEREVPRPVDRERQKDKYSGKKKRHTVRNAVVTAITGCILFVGATVSGHTHDKRIADVQYSFPEEWTVYQDTGYVGYRPGDNTFMPFKKPKGGVLTDEQKAYNRKVSAIRVKVEHHIGSAKILKVLREECRLRKNRIVYGLFHTGAAIHNLRRGFKLRY